MSNSAGFQVLCESVARKSLQLAQSVKIVEDIFFSTSNRVYNLGLCLNRLGPSRQLELSHKNTKIANVEGFIRFLDQNSSVNFLRLQWLDYTATLRARIIPKRVAVDMFSNQKSIGITNAVFGLLQQDQVVEGFPPIGEYELIPCFEGVRLAEREGYATVQGEFREKGGAQVPICPRTALRRIVEVAKKKGLSFLVGFELEVVLMTLEGEPLSHAHSWSNTSALRNPEIMDVLEEMVAKLERSKIKVEQFHPESAPGQYELVTGPLPPLESVDALLAARDIICAVAEKHRLRATFIPKPFPKACGTGAHVHISMTPNNCHKSFYAGVLAHLRSILAFTYCNPCSYERMQDSVWSGGQYVAWGLQNRETPLRKIEDSHWEFRCMDGFANSYLALAAILGAGVKGVMDERSLTIDDCQADPALLDVDSRRKLGIFEMLPKNFEVATACLDKDEELREVLGDGLVDTYLAIKGVETAMLNSMTDVERRKFLLERY
jgi:glutamine synthetase